MSERPAVCAGVDRAQRPDAVTVVGDGESTLARLALEIADLAGVSARLASTVPATGVVFVAHGDGPTRRAIIDDLVRDDIARVATVVHPHASVSPQASLGANVLIGARSVVAMQARVGHGTWQNALGSIEHDNVIGDHVFFGTAVTLCGRITIGDRAFLGGGAVVGPGRTIGADAVIGTGAVVIRDCAPGLTYVGNPARPLE